MKKFVISLGLVVICLGVSCSRSTNLAGGTDTETGGLVVTGKIRKADGSAGSNTQVQILRADYDPVAQGPLPDSLIDTTDEEGAFALCIPKDQVPDVEAPAFNIEAVHIFDRTRLLQRVYGNSGDTVEVEPNTLQAPGSIRVSISQTGTSPNGYVYIPGTSVYAPVQRDTTDSNYAIIDSVPAGLIPTVDYATPTGGSVVVAQDVEVSPEQTSEVKQTSPKVIYYSVGLRTDALYTGSASAQNGILTLGSPAPDNVGVGDEVRVGSDRYYISRRNSSTSFSIQTATGSAVPNFGQQSITIYRAFDRLNTALMAEFGGVCAADSNHLKTGDLVAGNIQLYIACYGDGVDDQQAGIRGWTTSPINYIKIFTPVSDTEVGNSQRHKGVWNSADAYAIHSITNGVDQPAINCNAPHVRIDGLQIEVESQYSGGSGILCYEQGNGEFDVSNSIVKATLHGPSGSGIGIYVYNNSGNGPFIRFWNNIVYDFADSASAGIQIHSGSTSGMIVNNTLANCYMGITGPIDQVALKNNLTNGCVRGIFPWNGYSAENDYNISSSKEWDLAAPHSRDSVFVQFVDSANHDFHVSLTDSIAKDRGLADPIPGLFSNDIDGQLRTTPWDVGADEALP